MVLFQTQVYSLSDKHTKQNPVSSSNVVEMTSEQDLVKPPSRMVSESMSDLDFIKSEIEEHQLSSAIFALSALIDKLRTEQNKLVEALFPKRFQDYRYSSRDALFPEDDFSGGNFGVIFSRRYQNDAQHTIDVNVVFSDPAIDEYVNIVKNKKLIQGLDHTRIVKVNYRYLALQKFSQEETYGERNIVINNDLMVNVVANGMKSISVLDDFCDVLALRQLEKLLKQ